MRLHSLIVNISSLPSLFTLRVAVWELCMRGCSLLNQILESCATIYLCLFLFLITHSLARVFTKPTNVILIHFVKYSFIEPLISFYLFKGLIEVISHLSKDFDAWFEILIVIIIINLCTLWSFDLFFNRVFFTTNILRTRTFNYSLCLWPQHILLKMLFQACFRYIKNTIVALVKWHWLLYGLCA